MNPERSLILPSLPIETEWECALFAHLVGRTNWSAYARRNQKDRCKLFNDAVVGKMGEFAAATYFGTEEPDLEIYASHGKSHGADLLLPDGRRLHVKTQRWEQGESFGVSWLFERNTPYVTTPGELDFLVLLRLLPGGSFELVTPEPIPAVRCVDLFGSPKSERLGMTKVALYRRDLERAGLLLDEGEAA